MQENTDQNNSEYGHFSRSVKCADVIYPLVLYDDEATLPALTHLIPLVSSFL